MTRLLAIEEFSLHGFERDEVVLFLKEPQTCIA